MGESLAPPRWPAARRDYTGPHAGGQAHCAPPPDRSADVPTSGHILRGAESRPATPPHAAPSWDSGPPRYRTARAEAGLPAGWPAPTRAPWGLARTPGPGQSQDNG